MQSSYSVRCIPIKSWIGCFGCYLQQFTGWLRRCLSVGVIPLTLKWKIFPIFQREHCAWTIQNCARNATKVKCLIALTKSGASRCGNSNTSNSNMRLANNEQNNSKNKAFVCRHFSSSITSVATDLELIKGWLLSFAIIVLDFWLVSARPVSTQNFASGGIRITQTWAETPLCSMAEIVWDSHSRNQTTGYNQVGWELHIQNCLLGKF